MLSEPRRLEYLYLLPAEITETAVKYLVAQLGIFVSRHPDYLIRLVWNVFKVLI